MHLLPTYACAAIISLYAGIALALSQSSSSNSSNEPGYFTNFTTLPSNISNSFSFGPNYAVIHGDIVNDVTTPIANTTLGSIWLQCLNTWVDAVQNQSPRPLTFFTRLYWENSHYPDVKPGSPLAKWLGKKGIVVGAGSFDGNLNATVQDSELEGAWGTQLYPSLRPVQDSDIVLEKTRNYAGFGNELEAILAAQGIDTVILSGLRTSGEILTTAINLIALNYNVYVITNTTAETPSNALGADVQIIDQVVKMGVLPSVFVEVITLEQALGALNRSRPAVY